MRDSGLAHLLSVSGMHIAVAVGGTMRVALRWPVKIIAGAAAAGVAYTLLAGAEVPTVRSCLATLIVLVGLYLGRQAISLRTVAAAAFLILLVRPDALLPNVIAIPFTGFVIMPAAAAAWLFDPLGLVGPAYAALGWSLDVLIWLADTVAGRAGAVSPLPTLAVVGFVTASGCFCGKRGCAGTGCLRSPPRRRSRRPRGRPISSSATMAAMPGS